MLTGTLSIPKTGNVTLQWQVDPYGWSNSTEAIINGVFARSFGFGIAGTWQFRVIWLGDATSNPAISNTVTVTVAKVTPTLTLTANVTTVAQGGVIGFTGTLSPSRSGNVALTWQIGTGPSYVLGGIPMTNGLVTFSFSPNQGAGTYQFRLSWPRDAGTNSATSNPVTVIVT